MYPIQDFSIPPAVVPEFVPTDVAAVAGIARTVADTFRARTTRPLEWRRVQLRRLYWALHDLQPLLTDALMRDLHRPPYETVLTELVMVADDCILALANLDRWAADERVTDMPLPLRALGHTVHKEPLGPVLVIGTYNFPLQMCLNPLVGAIAAGCTAVIKPSENAPATAAAIAHLVRERLDASAFAVVNGPVDRATALLDAGDDPATRWGKILYTGNQHVAKIIARRAADSLTPCILELGGNNPAVVTNAADVSLAARRILWAVAVNAGQVCVKPNYVLVQRGVVDEFIAATRRHIAAFFPDGARQSPDFARMVNQAQFARVRGMIEGTNGTVVAGGETDEDELYIEPTYILVDDPSDPAMKDEAFGPLVAVLPFDDLDEAIAVANATCATPLAVYVFGSKSESEKVLSHTHSGGASVNDVFSHASFAHAPFGGVGSSGTGSYRGRASFDAFTHRRTVATVPRWAEHLLDVRYMPYRFGKLKFARAALAPSVDFDRNGNVVRGWRWWIRRAVSVLAVVAAARALVGWGGGLDRLSGYLARLLGQK